MKGRLALDSNILVYAELEPETVKGRRAHRIVEACAPRGILAVQSLLEFAAVVRRKRPESLESALNKIEAWSRVFETAPTTSEIMRRALALARERDLQIWDAVILSASAAAGATTFLSEDMQDGATFERVRIVNPFAVDDEEIAALVSR